MTTYGADATGTYNAPNYVTGKEGVKDSSAAMFLAAAGNAAEKGLAIDEAYQAREYRTELTKLTDFELAKGRDVLKSLQEEDAGTSEGSATAALLTEREDVFNFRKEVDRAAQLKKLEGKTAEDRIKFQMQRRLREKVADRPWLADTYRNVAGDVINDYSAAVKFVSEAEQKYLSDTSSEKRRENLIAQAYKLAAEVNIAFPKPLEMMTEGELFAFNMEASRVRQYDRLADEKFKEAQLRMQLAQTNATLAGAEATRANTALMLEDRNARENDRDWANATFGSFSARGNAKIVEVMNKLKTVGFIPTDEQALERDVTLFVANERALFEEQVRKYSWSDTSLRDREIAAFNERMNALTSAFTGDLSNPAERLRALHDLQTQVPLNLYKNSQEAFNMLTIVGPQGAGVVAAELFSGKDGKNNLEVIRQGVNGITAREEDAVGAGVKAWNEVSTTGRPTSLPETSWNAVRSETLNILKGASTDPVLRDVYDAQPVTWANSLDFILSARDQFGPQDTANVIDYGLYNFRTRYEGLKKADPNKAYEIAYSSKTIAENAVPRLMNDAANLFSGGRGQITLTKDGRFVAPGNSNIEVRMTVSRLNNVFETLSAIEGSATPYELAKKYLGVEDNASQPQ